jgi:hypothetical protein
VSSAVEVDSEGARQGSKYRRWPLLPVRWMWKRTSEQGEQLRRREWQTTVRRRRYGLLVHLWSAVI